MFSVKTDGTTPQTYFGLTSQGFYDDEKAALVSGLTPSGSVLGWSFPKASIPSAAYDWRWAKNDYPLPIPKNCPEPPSGTFSGL
ncbi:MAG: hypothetical protein Ta2G_16600 [Termitinemataceae bacterium]|nr:MAG: hypothetical protein Ta2G_16600 [Termitinemataceae bacterium]